jgi:DNA-binding helix-hairpin-helix protein with protein kinase domain
MEAQMLAHSHVGEEQLVLVHVAWPWAAVWGAREDV